MEETQIVRNPIQKAFNYSFEIQKDAIDLEDRIIEGFATTEGIDREDQVVALSAVEKALKLYLKNPTIRADHGPPPIGKTIDAKPRILNGIKGLWIRAQIGKGTRACEDAWNGIRQGLYNAFSIGGIVKGIKTIYSRKLGKHIQKITEFLISEISITDAPANQECMFEIIAKSVNAHGLEDRDMTETKQETEKDFTKEFESFSKRVDTLEVKFDEISEATSKQFAEIKELLTKSTDEEDEEKNKENEEEEEKS
jgi:hypothetical protein